MRKARFFGTIRTNMKKDIHPAYFADAVITCACGAKHPVGSTKADLSVEICSACHPFYTGTDKILDTAGRVEKFKKRREAAKASPGSKIKKSLGSSKSRKG